VLQNIPNTALIVPILIFKNRCKNHEIFKIVYLDSHFNNQLTHTTLKNVELLKHFKISKTAPTCFGLQGNRHQGVTISTQLKITHFVNL